MNWKELINDLYHAPNQLELVARKFAQQLNCDRLALEQQGAVSICGIDAPQLNTLVDKQTGLAHKIASILFPIETSITQEDINNREFIKKVSDKIGSYISYRRLLGRLRKAYRHQIAPKPKELTIYQQARLNGTREIYHQLKQDQTIPDVIANPQPMEVSVAPLNELQPFFQFLQNQDANSMVDEEGVISFTRGTQFADGRMDMCKQVVGSPWISQLMESIRNNQNIKHFLLGNNIIGFEGAKAIARFLKHKHRPQIKTWYLAGNDIDSRGIKLISDELCHDKTIQALWLKRNPIGIKGAIHLSDMLRHNQNIEILDLHNTAIFDQGVSYLFESLKDNHSMDSLYLDGNAITQEGAYVITNYFNQLNQQKRKGISTLYLSINRIGDQGAIALAQSLAQYPHLKRLSLGSNRIEAQGGREILAQFVNHPSLIYLDLGGYKSTSDMCELPNNMGDEIVPALCDFIRKNKTLQSLSIRDNNISLAGLELIVDALEDNNTLLDFSYEQFGLRLYKNLIDRIRFKLKENVSQGLGITWQEFKNNRLRYIKHDQAVKNIDSIYRNRACILPKN